MGPPGGDSLPRMPHAALLFALALTLALGAAAYTRNAVWRGDLSLWSDAAAAGLLERARALLPGYWAIHYNLGNEYLLLDRLDEAETSYRRALAINAERPAV